jgi:hypothetical protein
MRLTGGIAPLDFGNRMRIACILPLRPDRGTVQPPRKDLNGGTIIIKDQATVQRNEICSI